MKKFVPANYQRVLEIGCGVGNFRQNLDLEHEYWGVEVDKEAAQLANKALDKVLTGTYQDTQHELPDHYFDLVVCNDVIEHIDQYEEFLQKIQSKLSENGCLVASIPNVRFLPNLFELLILKDWRYRDAGILDRTHLRFFTLKSLRRVMIHTGWEIEVIEGINRYGGRPWMPRRLLSYVGQLILGRDTAYLQFALRASKKSKLL